MTDASAIELAPNVDTTVAIERVRAWLARHIPRAWAEAAASGGSSGIRAVRSRVEYAAWYPVFGRSGLVVPTWPVEYGGLGISQAVARAIEPELQRYNLGRLNPLGLNNTAAPLFAHGTEAQRRRFLPPIVRNEEQWCQLFSEPGAGSDLYSLSTRAVLDGDEWRVTGQKVWTTWALEADFAILLARTNPEEPKRRGLTYFLIDMRQPGVVVRPLRHLTGESEFCEVFLDNAVVPDTYRVGAVNDGWRVAGSTLSGERQMVAGAGSGGVGRIGGSGTASAIALARSRSAGGRPGGWEDAPIRDALMGLLAEERIRDWTNQRVRAELKANRDAGPASSIGKVHQASLNQRLQVATVAVLGADALAWESNAPDYAESLPFAVKGMLRSRANSIEGGTTEINKDILAERVLGLPREPDPWRDAPWRDIPRS